MCLDKAIPLWQISRRLSSLLISLLMVSFLPLVLFHVGLWNNTPNFFETNKGSKIPANLSTLTLLVNFQGLVNNPCMKVFPVTLSLLSFIFYAIYRVMKPCFLSFKCKSLFSLAQPQRTATVKFAAVWKSRICLEVTQKAVRADDLDFRK